MPDIVDLSIIIVNWNAQIVTRACIDSIVTHLHGLSYEILLVDNGSSDKSAQHLGKSPHTRVIENESNLGFAKANNIGMKQARGRVFLLLNNDTLILDNSIQNTFEFLCSHPEVGMMGCMLLNADRTLQRSCSNFPGILTALLGRQVVIRAFKAIRPQSEFPIGSAYLDEDHQRELRPDWIMGAFMMVRHEAVDGAGMLDEDYFMYAEDMDWCYRIRRAGWDIAYSPAASIIHLGGASSRTVPEATLRRRLASSVLYFRKHRPDELRAALAFQYTSFLMELMIRSLSLPFAGEHNREECLNILRQLCFFPEEIRRAMRQRLTSAPSLSGGPTRL
ncbi:MAG: glycosyltransferase family 2 protein [Acidobacteriota bacterium]|nr:glycosyltransferase family 2 protein [Acidobacteriota bacterium]